MNNFRCRPFAYKFFGSILEVVTKQTPEEKEFSHEFPKSIASPMSSTKNSSKHNTLYFRKLLNNFFNGVLLTNQYMKFIMEIIHESMKM